MVGNGDTANATIDRALVDLAVYRVGYERGRSTAEARLAQAEAERDKWLKAFNESEQFQSGPTKRAETADARLAALQVAMSEIARQAKMWAAIDVDRAFLRDGLRRVADRLEALHQMPAGPYQQYVGGPMDGQTPVSTKQPPEVTRVGK